MSSNFPLSGKVAVVTGASAPNGIGRAIALRLAQDGAAIVVTDVAGSLSVDGKDCDRLDLLAGLANEIQSGGGNALALAVDVTDEGQIADCVDRTTETFGTLDILVNNAGTTVGAGPLLGSTREQWEMNFRVNLLGPTLFCQAVIPIMQAAGGGNIINIGSIGSLGAHAAFGAYTAMKHGVIGMTKTIAAEFGVDGIRCNAVCPGYVKTDMHEGANKRLAAARGISVDEIKMERYAEVALRRAGDPSEIADTVAFLAGPASSYVTGVALPVSGGTPVGL